MGKVYSVWMEIGFSGRDLRLIIDSGLREIS